MLRKGFLLLAIFQLLILIKPALCTSEPYVHPKFTENSAFIASRDGKVFKEIGQGDVRSAPFSTFKITLALIGFDAGILKDKDIPVWAFQEAYLENFPKWLKPGMVQKYKWDGNHTPATFMRQSVLWYSYEITKRLGKDKFKDYVKKLNYGNKDVTGTPGKEDGLYSSWLGTSLKISPRELS